MSNRIASAPVPGRRFNLTSARPSLRVGVVAAAAAVIVVMALVLSTAAATRLRETATEAARHNVESIVRGYIDPSLHAETFNLQAFRDPGINPQLERLSLAGAIRLINLWSPDGTIVYS